MVDKVKPLKIENSATGGTQNDMLPVEANPAQDYLAAAGLSLAGLDTILIGNDGTNLTFLDLANAVITLAQLRYAKGLDDATGVVDVSAAAAPSIGQVLTATSAVLATWQTPFVQTNGEVDDTSSANITTTDGQVGTMTVTPPAGNYLVWFTADFNSPTSGIVVTLKTHIGGVDGNQVKFMPFAGGTLTAGSQRVVGSVIDRVTVNGSQAIQIFASTSSGTVACANKCMMYLRVP